MEVLERSCLFTRVHPMIKAVIGLLILATVALRVAYGVSRAVPSFNPDELAIQMNARFLTEAGKDEWGKSWPWVFRSFGDAKLPGYIWVTAAAGQLTNWSPQSVRYPALIASLLLPLIIAGIAITMFAEKKVWLTTWLWFLVVPWIYHYGSVGFESLWSLAWWSLAVLLLFVRPARWQGDVGAALCFLIAALSYNSPILLLPFLLIALVLWRWNDKPSLIRGGLLLVSAGLVTLFVTLQAAQQKQGISLFQDPTLLAVYPEFRLQFASIPLLPTLIGNKWVFFGQHVVMRWFASWSWEFLVIRGGQNPWHTIPGFGHMSSLVWVGAVVGFGGVIGKCLSSLRRRSWHALRRWLSILVLVGSSLAPAVITVDAPHATRSLWFFCWLLLLAGWSWTVAIRRLCACEITPWRRRASVFLQFVVIGLIVLEWSRWWFAAPRAWSEQADKKWNVGLSEELHAPGVEQAPRVFIVDPSGVLYTYVVQATQMPAAEFLTTVRRSAPDTAGLVRVERVGKFEFVFAPQDAEAPGVLLWQNQDHSWDTKVL